MAKSQKFKRGWQFVFVGACLQANRAGQRALPRANNRRQAGSYRGVCTGQQPALHSGGGLSLWELACKRIAPRQTAPGRAARWAAVFLSAAVAAGAGLRQAVMKSQLSREVWYAKLH